MKGARSRFTAFLLTLLKIAVGIYILAAILLFFFQNYLIFPAPRGGTRDPKDAGISEAEILEIETKAGKLHGYLLFPKAVPRRELPAILLFHGNGENVTFDAGWLDALRNLNIAVAAVDYPGYGLSEGSPTEESLVESGVAALAALRARSEIDKNKIVLLGSSIGTGVAVAVAAREKTAGVILQSPFDSLANVAMAHYPIFPRFLLRTTFDSLSRIVNVTSPILILHGDRDSIIPIAHGRALAAAGKTVRAFQTVDGAGHNNLMAVASARYFTWVREFVREVTAPVPK